MFLNICHKSNIKIFEDKEPSNIWENELPGDSIERTLGFPSDFIGNISKSQKILMVTPPKNYVHVMMLIFLLHQDHEWIFKMQLKEDIPKQRNSYIEAFLIYKEYQMLDIYVEKIPRFFGNTSEDVKKHLFKFNNACDVFNLSEDNTTMSIICKKSTWECS